MKVMEALYEKMAPEVDLVDKMLPFAGIATIGDVMDLQDENRILVKEGLQRLMRQHLPLMNICSLS